MAHVVKYHPSISLLEQYSDGTLAPELCLIVAAHLDFCPHCQTLHHDIEADLGCELAMQQLVLPQPVCDVHSVAIRAHQLRTFLSLHHDLKPS